MFGKGIVCAMALVLCALDAPANNFRGADQVYVPIAGHASGSSGLFVTDVYIANLTNESVDVAVIYVPLGPNEGANTPRSVEDFRGRIQLRGLERRELPDLFVNTLGKTAESNPLGMLIFTGCLAGTSCGVDTQDATGDSENFRPISVQTRIYQVTQPGRAAPTTGQLFTGLPWHQAASLLNYSNGLDRVFVTGLTHTGGAGQAGTFRSNIGVVNASEYSTTEIVFTLYQGTMNETDKLEESVRSLGPLGNMQYGFSQLFPGRTGSNFFVTVHQRNVRPVEGGVVLPGGCQLGCPGFFAYGSVLDNISGDATTMEAQYLDGLDSTVLAVLYPGAGPGTDLRRRARH